MELSGGPVAHRRRGSGISRYFVILAVVLCRGWEMRAWLYLKSEAAQGEMRSAALFSSL